ncbi:hypothetical protein DPEC_G00358640 [Dallia pectoralis]|uniref:Uncharacterized protein n=1 Tax=Dallia pectoralis TaxID=75939 RepID=A0ACC2F0E2_DALPE|nr:hypothetical protein DPEC_G00358640 [Dallia pectoralis]
MHGNQMKGPTACWNPCWRPLLTGRSLISQPLELVLPHITANKQMAAQLAIPLNERSFYPRGFKGISIKTKQGPFFGVRQWKRSAKWRSSHDPGRLSLTLLVRLDLDTTNHRNTVSPLLLSSPSQAFEIKLLQQEVPRNETGQGMAERNVGIHQSRTDKMNLDHNLPSTTGVGCSSVQKVHVP